MVPGLYEQKLSALAQAFSPAAPVTSRGIFAGRQTQLSACIETIGMRGLHGVIFGERGVGKTSLANILQLILSNNSINVAKISCEASDDLSVFWRKVFDRLRVEVTDARRTAGLQSEVVEKKSAIPVSAYFEDKKEWTGDVVDKAFSALQGPSVIIADEFDRLDSKFDRKTFADRVKKLSDDVLPVTIIVVGVAETVTQLIGDHESIGRCLKQIHMPTMSPAELTEICVKGFQILGMTAEPRVITEIVRYSHGYPHFTHLLAYNAAKASLLESSLQISSRHLALGIEQSIGETNESLRSSYQKATHATRDNLIEKVLWACASVELDENGTFRASDLAPKLSQFCARDVKLQSYIRTLGDFCTADRGAVLVKIGKKHNLRYRFKNPLMRAFVWMKVASKSSTDRSQLDLFLRG